MENEVSLASEQPQANTVSLASPMQPAPMVSQDELNQRAQKTEIGIGDLIGMNADQIKQEMLAGRESTLRIKAAADLNIQKQKDKLNLLTNMATEKGGPLTGDEVNSVLDPFNPNNKPVDPDSVTEAQYAAKYVGSLQQAAEAVRGSDIKTAQQQTPEQYNNASRTGSELVAKMEYADRLYKDQSAALSQQGLASKGWDYLKDMFQPYQEYTFRGLTPGVSDLAGITLGNNLQAQADHLVELPLDQYTQQLKNITSKLSPLDALKFLDYVRGLPSSDRMLDNVFSAMSPLDYAAIGETAVGAVRGIDLARRTNQAVRSLVQAAETVGPSAAGRAEVQGDLSTAATLKSSDVITKTIEGQGDPLANAEGTLYSVMNQAKDKIGENIGNLSREQAVRIQNQFDASRRGLIQRLVDSARINRTPMALQVRNAVDLIKGHIADQYRGARNTILDVSDPLYEPKSNTWWFDVTRGNHDGTLFSNPETANNFLKQYGINDAKVIEGSGPITNSDVQALLDRKVQVQKNIEAAEEGIRNNKARAVDESLTDEARTKATEQHKGLSGFKQTFEKELDEINLRLKSNETYDRVSALQAEVDRLRDTNKSLRSSLKRGVGYEKGSEALQQLKDSIKFGAQEIKSRQAEIDALRSGTAEVAIPPTRIQQHGVGWKIVERRPLRETDSLVRDLMIRDANGELHPEALSINNQTGIKAFWNAAVGKFRGADDTQSLNESIQRKIGTYTQNIFKEWANQEASYIKQIATGNIKTDPVTGEKIPFWQSKPIAIWHKITGETKETHREFIRALEHARSETDPNTGQIGYFYETPGQLRDFYQRSFGRDPTYPEQEAYFAFVRMYEGDRILREISEFRNRARLGVEQVSINALDKTGARVRSDYFDGRMLNKFPGGDDVIMVMGRRQGEERIYNLGGAGIAPKQLEEYRQAVEEGRKKIVEVYAPEFTPLRDFSDIAGNEHVRYILTDAPETKPLEFNHVNRRSGGHFDYDYDHFLKQPKMYHQYENVNGVRGRYKSVYVGDTTFMPLLNRAMGRDIAGKMHEIQRLIRDGNLTEAERFTRANLPIEWNQLHDMFKPGRDDQGKIVPPQLDLNEPFVVVPRGRTVLDMDDSLAAKYGSTFKDAAKTGSLNKQFQVAYNTERESYGLRHFEDRGTQGNPLYQYAPEGKFVDPITSMNRALNRIVNSVFMDDYKMYAVEHWLREAEPYLDSTRAKLARSSPFWVFNSATDKTAFRAGVPWEKVQNLLGTRYKINQFVGIPSKFDTAIQSMKQSLVDWSYSKFGPEGQRSLSKKALTVLPVTVLDHIHDPVTWIRSMTFHEKLGLFNPAQLLVHIQTFANIMAVSPFHSVSGTYATLLHQWSRFASEDMLDHLDDYATKINVFGKSRWRPGEWKEARKLMSESGFDRVAGEYANLNTALKTDFVGNDFKSFLNAGTIFFEEGVKAHRYGAFYTAYREFREVNPTGAISKSDLGKILQRADLLDVNMSRASNSAMQSGLFSLPTQFLTYNLRQAELFLGNRIDGAAKARLALVYGLLYGAPTVVGLTGLPMVEQIRQEAINRGYVVGENWLKSAIMEGIPATMLAWITGGGDTQKGNYYNIGNRFGVSGLDQLSELFADNGLWQILGGAAGTSLMDTLTGSSNFLHAMASATFNHSDGNPFPLKLDDFVDIFKDISTVNQGWKIYAALNTGKWMSRNEAYIGNVTAANAAFMAMTGLSPQEQDDAYVKRNIMNHQRDYQRWVVNQYLKEQRRGYQAQAAHEYAQARQYFTRASTLLRIGGLSFEQRSAAIARSLKGQQSIVNDTDYQMYRTAPESRSDLFGIPMPFTTQTNMPQTRLNQFRETRQLQQLRGQE